MSRIDYYFKGMSDLLLNETIVTLSGAANVLIGAAALYNGEPVAAGIALAGLGADLALDRHTNRKFNELERGFDEELEGAEQR